MIGTRRGRPSRPRRRRRLAQTRSSRGDHNSTLKSIGASRSHWIDSTPTRTDADSQVSTAHSDRRGNILLLMEIKVQRLVVCIPDRTRPVKDSKALGKGCFSLDECGLFLEVRFRWRLVEGVLCHKLVDRFSIEEASFPSPADRPVIPWSTLGLMCAMID